MLKCQFFISYSSSKITPSTYLNFPSFNNEYRSDESEKKESEDARGSSIVDGSVEDTKTEEVGSEEEKVQSEEQKLVDDECKLKGVVWIW